MPAYATAADYTAYTGDAPVSDAELQRASRMIDVAMGAVRVRTVGAYAGLKFDLTELQDWEAQALTDATCAQAKYAVTLAAAKAAQAAAADADGKVSARKGPDFEVSYFAGKTYDPVDAVQSPGTGRYGPDVALELDRISHLRALSGTARI